MASSEVDAWFASNKPPAEAALQRARQVILGADGRMSEYIKYGSVLFGYGGDFASFVQAKKKTVSVMFNRGAHIKGDFPNLEGTGPTARFMRFATVDEVERHAAELARVAKAWCDQVDTSGASPARR
jgi:Domain of unknown function (DU1801)